MKKRNLKKPMISALEQRILFDGAAVATAVDVLDESSFSSNNSTQSATSSNDVTQNNAENSVHEAQAVQGFERDRREVAFVDVTVSDYQTLVDGVGEGVEVYLVSSLDDINSILKSETNIDAIHILSHGNTGEITVGNDVLNQNTLNNFDTVLQTMKNSLSENGDILLYGCNVASDGTGQEFIDTLASITEADVAASDDVTGNSALGGDWNLEVNSGSIEAEGIVVENYDGKLAASIIMDNGFIKTAISQDGTLGIGSTGKPGIQYDSNGGGDDYKDTADYLTPGAPQELFSIKHDGILETNNNTNFTRPAMATTISGDSNQVIAVSKTADGKLEITQIYSLPEGAKVFTVNVTIKNISDSTVSGVKYLRSTDPDVDSNGLAGSTSSTNNIRGTDKYAAEDLVLSQGPVSGRVIGLYSSSTVEHNTSVSQWTKDPDVALAGGNIGNGDKTIDIGFNIGTLTAGSSQSFGFLYVFGDDIPEAEATIKTADNNTAPTSTTIPAQNILEDFSSYTIDLKTYFSDAQTTSDKLNYSYRGNDNIKVSISDGIATITQKTANWNGTENITFIASDSYGLSSSQTVAFNVAAVNDAPTVANNANLKLQAINEDISSTDNIGTRVDILFDPVFNDIDTGDSLGSVIVESIGADASTEGVYEYYNGTTWSTVAVGTILNDTYKIRFTPKENYFGTPGTITVKLRDRVAGETDVLASSGTATLSVQVNSVNDIPVITSAGAATITETSADDVPSSSLLTSGALTGTLTGTDVEDDNTTLSYSIQGGTLSDVTYTLQGKYGVLSLDRTTNDWTYTPNRQEALNALAAGDTDTDEFMFKIIDSNGAQANQSLVISLVGANDTPELKVVIIDQTFSGNGDWIYQIPANTFLDREGNGLTYSVEQVDIAGNPVNGGLLPTGVTFDEATRSFLGDKDNITNGNFYVKVRATDPESASITDTFQVTFTDVENSAPVVANPIDRVAIASGTTGVIPITVSDIFSDDGGVVNLTYSASIAGQTINDDLSANKISFNTTNKQFEINSGVVSPGKYIIDLTATDAQGLFVTTQFVIYVDDGNPSTISAVTPISDQIWDGSGEHTFKIPSNAFTFDDVGDTVTYSAKLSDENSLPTWLTLDPTTGVLSGNPPHGAAATYAIVITASETTGSETATSGFTLNITNPNDAPIVNGTAAAADQLVKETDASFNYNFGELFIDPDGTANGTSTTSTLTYSAEVWNGTAWVAAPSWLRITGTTISGIPIGNVPFLDIKLIATDAGEASNETTFKLDLQDPAAKSSVGAYTANDPGVVSVTGTPIEGQTLTVDSITDPNGNPTIATYQWQVSNSNAPDAVWTDISNATNENYTLTNNEAGKYVRAKVFYTDGGNVAETQESTALSIANLDDTGTATLSGTMLSGSVLVASVTDSDGLVGVEPTYTWYRSDTNDSEATWTKISGATGSSYTLTNDDGDKYIKVVVSYTDNQKTANTPEAISSTKVQLGSVAPIAVNDTAIVTEAGGVSNATAGTSPISGNLFTNDTDQNSGDTKTLVEVRVGSIEGAGSGVVSGVDGVYTIIGSYGTLTINQTTGAYTYTLDETNVYVEGLNVGNSLIDSFNYTIKDSTNLNDIAVLSITINGADDELVVTTDVNTVDLIEAGGVNNTDSGTNQATITFTAKDVDNEVKFDLDNTWTQQSDINKYIKTTDYGSILFDISTGVMTYTISNDSTAVQALKPDDVVKENISIKISSKDTNIVTKDVEFVIKGTNDIPTITIGDVEGSIVETVTLNDSGSITFKDMDLAHRPIATEATKSVTAVGQDGTTALSLTAQQKSDIENAFSIINVNTNTNNGTVTWDYTITEGKLDFLGAGEVVTAVFTITVTDDANATATQDVTVTITGTNDAPTITVIDDNGAIVEGTKLGDNGSISFADLDLTDRPTATEVTSSVTAIAQNGSAPLTLTAQQQSDIENAFSIINVNTNTNDGTITWDYTITENQLDFLGQGEVVTAVFTITVTDDEGATATQNITVTITGTNDAPTISIIDEIAEIVEGTKLSDNGSVTFADLDLTDKPIATEATKSVNLIGQNGTPLVLTAQQQSDIENAFVITNVTGNSNNGTVTWDYIITEEKINFLGQGEKVTAVFTITVTDDEKATATQDVTVTITGTNDAPIIQIVDNTAEIKDKTTLSDKGSITFSDLDLTDKPLATEIMKSINGSSKSGSTLVLTVEQKNNIENAFVITNVSTNTNNGTINWDYQIDQKAVEFLGDGEKVTAVFTITVTDDEGAIATQDVTVTIIGTNDVPEVSLENIDAELSFGDKYNKDISTLFSDKDLTDIFTFEAVNLPQGLSIDSKTGIISGMVSSSGDFVIVLKATDSTGASVTKTYNMLVVAPPSQNEVVDVTPPSDNLSNNDNGNNQNNNPFDGLSNFNNDTTNDNFGIINYNMSDGITIDTGSGFLNTGGFTDNQGFQNSSQGNGSADQITSNSTGNNDNRGVLQANVDLNVLTNGQIVFNEANQDSFSIVGITIEDIRFENNYIEIKVVDTNLSQNFIVTQIDGTALPAGLFFDPRTGNISGTIPEDLEKLEISIKAINQDGTTRVLNLKLDLKELKKAQKDQVDADEKYMGLKEQIALENQKLDDYGSYLTRLFA